MDIVNRLLLMLLGVAAVNPVYSNTPPVEKALLQQLNNDQEVVLTQRRGLADTLSYMRSEGDLFTGENSQEQLITREQKERIWSTWVSFLDRLLLLDSIGQTYDDHNYPEQGPLHKMAFRTAYAAFLARYRFTLDFLDITERSPLFHTLLNDAIPELGLGQGTYAA